MKKLLIALILIAQLLFSVLAKPTEQDLEKEAEGFKNNYIKEFEKNVRDYLTKKNIYKNENIKVSKEEFKKIFKDLMAGDEANISESFKETYNKLAEEFVKDAYPKDVEYVKGSEIHKYFEYQKIMDIFNKYVFGSKNNENSHKNDL
jgi:hypothetical protein